jgi:hypothetical protein
MTTTTIPVLVNGCRSGIFEWSDMFRERFQQRYPSKVNLLNDAEEGNMIARTDPDILYLVSILGEHSGAPSTRFVLYHVPSELLPYVSIFMTETGTEYISGQSRIESMRALLLTSIMSSDEVTDSHRERYQLIERLALLHAQIRSERLQVRRTV